jgi:diguanylate cyclase (GGDEF)-like protein
VETGQTTSLGLPALARRAGVPRERGFPAGIVFRLIALLGCSLLAIPFVLVAIRISTWDWHDVAIFTFAVTAVPALMMYRFLGLVAYARGQAADAARSSAWTAAILDATPLPVRVLSPGGAVLLMNEAATRWDERGLFKERSRDDAGEELQRRSLTGEEFHGSEVMLKTHHDETRQAQLWTAPIRRDGNLDAIVAVYADVTEQRRRDEHVRFLAERDPLTGLFNRRGFLTSLERAVKHERAATSILAIIDIDNFKLVNDSAGHAAGDALLKGLAQELARVLRPDDVLTRLSGDEFAVALIGDDLEEVHLLVERLLKATRRYRLETSNESISVTASIGICRLRSGIGPKEALEHADAALYEAKEQGRNRIVAWRDSPERRALRSATLGWTGTINDALDEDRFLLYLQPIVALATGETVRYEALARLRRRDGSIVLPSAFLPPARHLGLMPAIDSTILEKVVELIERDPSLSISVNLSVASFEDDDLLDRLEQLFTISPVLGGRLGIEITEQTSLRDIDRAQRRLKRLNNLHCAIAIDDFGTGFASFAHLRELPVEIVKISHTFVHNIDTDPTAAALVEAIVTVSHALGKHVIAEGVERAEIAEILRTHQVRYAQGYLFGGPAPAESITGGHLCAA